MAYDSETLGLRTNYYLGFYDDVMSEAKEMKGSSSEFVDVYYFRAMLEKKPDMVVRSIPARATTALQAVKQLATYRTSSREGKDLVLETMGQWLEDESMKENVTLQLLAADIYIQEENYRAALELVHGDRDNLDKMGMQVQILLKLDRPDLAQRVVESMLGVEDDDCMTILCGSYIAVALGTETKLEQAKLNLEELVERYGPSVVIYNALASCMILLRKYPRAFTYLKNARDQAKKENRVTPAETLINTAMCLQQMNKTQFISNIITELETTHPNHPWLKSQKDIDSMFTKCAQNYA